MDYSPEIIQQWQYTGRVPLDILNGAAYNTARKSGITSFQSYVTWSEIEREKGVFDFTAYDEVVDKLKRNGLRWVPFLILGPAYSVPSWFHGSPDSLYAKCLEHQVESRIQSIWNPALPGYVERFIESFFYHYRDIDVIESVLIGISGNWGEALYPVSGGFGELFHTHAGWWCGDLYAKDRYCEYLMGKFSTIENLNSVYGTSLKSFDSVEFPITNMQNSIIQKGLSFIYRITGKILPHVKFAIIKRLLKHIMVCFYYFPNKRCQYDDFVSWYKDEMTRWVDLWLSIVRKYYKRKLYVVNGGDSNPQMGACFSDQAKVAAKYGAGVRTTNQTDNYRDSFILTALTATACNYYDTYFITEEAYINSPEGIIARIFDSVSTGACGFYCKSFIGTGIDLCSGKKTISGKPTEGIKHLVKNIHLLTKKPERSNTICAVLFPDQSISYGMNPWRLYSFCGDLREHLDFDLIDESLIGNGILEQYGILIIYDCWLLNEINRKKLQEWVMSGGVLFYPEEALFDSIINSSLTKIKKLINNKGELINYRGRSNGYIPYIMKEIVAMNKVRFQSNIFIDPTNDGVFISMYNDYIIMYNSGESSVAKIIKHRSKVLYEGMIDQYSIHMIPMEG